MILPCRPLLLSLLLFFHSLAAGNNNYSVKHASVNSESRDKGGIADNDTRLFEEKFNPDSHLERSGDDLTRHSSQADFPCPSSAAIAPCVCTADADSNIGLDCTAVESEEQLATVFQQEFPVKELHNFSMASNNAIIVLRNILNGVTFESIVLEPGPFALEQISEYFIFDSKDTLTSVRVVNSQLSSDYFPFAILSQMEKLDDIYIYRSFLTWIPPLGAPKLSDLTLAHGLTDILEAGSFPIHEWPTTLLFYVNQIRSVAPGSFFFADENSAASSEKIFFDLNLNKLESLQAGSFPLRNSAITIYLHTNQIASIEPGTFVLPEATETFSLLLSLHGNQLTSFDETVFGDLMPFITELRLYGNPLSCGCDIAWLVLNAAFMAKIDPDAACDDGTLLHDLDPLDYVDFCRRLAAGAGI